MWVLLGNRSGAHTLRPRLLEALSGLLSELIPEYLDVMAPKSKKKKTPAEKKAYKDARARLMGAAAPHWMR